MALTLIIILIIIIVLGVGGYLIYTWGKDLADDFIPDIPDIPDPFDTLDRDGFLDEDNGPKGIH